MKKRRSLPVKHLSLLIADPVQQNLIIAAFRQHGIPVHYTTTWYDENYPYLYWEAGSLTQTRDPRSGTKNTVETVDEFLNHFFVLSDKTVTVTLNENHTAVISQEGIQVGCQTFTFEAIEELHSKMQDFKN